MPVRRDLRAMNSDIELLCCAPEAERRLDRACRWLAVFEARFSRFRELSELSRLNRAAGRPFRASPSLYCLVELSLDLARRSAGLFDPTVLRALEASGYDRSFELIRSPVAASRKSGSGSNEERSAGARLLTWRDVRLDRAARTIELHPGGGIDLGGIGKGWAVDRLAGILGTPCLVNGGGDICALGCPPGADAWLIGVEDPRAPEHDLAVLSVRDRGVATSSRLRRAWLLEDRPAHHLIDSRTGRPSASDAAQVTAVAPSTLLADYHAKMALLLGVEAGRRYLEAEPDVQGLIVRNDGAIIGTDGLGAYMAAA